MKPHPKIRKTVKWGGAAVTLLLVVVWIGSGRWQLLWVPRVGFALGAQQGVLLLAVVAPSDGPRLFELRRNDGSDPFVYWHFRCYRTPISTQVDLPLWILALPPMSSSLIAWRMEVLAHRRARLNLCPKCHYDRAGLAAGAKCPECGTAQMSA
jgi:hypothetical protein